MLRENRQRPGFVNSSEEDDESAQATTLTLDREQRCFQGPSLASTARESGARVRRNTHPSELLR